MNTKLNAPSQRGQHLQRGRLDRQVRPGREQARHHRGVGGGVVVQAQVDHLLGQLGRVHQVAVVGQRDRGRDPAPVRAGRGRPQRGLRVLPVGRAGGGVAGVADRDVAAQAGQRGLVEDLGDQAEVLVDHDPGPVADRDAGRLLTAVLQRVQPEVGQLRDLFAAGPDTEHTALVLRTAVVVVEVVAEHAVASRHLPLLRDRGWADRMSSLCSLRAGPRPRSFRGSVCCPHLTSHSPHWIGNGKYGDRSARIPLAVTFPVRTASAQPSRPVANRTKAIGSASITFGGVPRVCRGPATH